MTKEYKIKKESGAWGIASFVTAIVSIILVFMPYFGLPLSVFSMIAYGIQKTKSGFATAGLIIGIISFMVNLIMTLIVIVVLLAV